MNYRRFFRITAIVMMAIVMLCPLDAEAARKRRKTSGKATTTATTSKKKVKKSSSTQNYTSSRRKSSSARRGTSVTSATRAAATKASAAVHSSPASASGKPASKSGSSLTKIKVEKPNLEEIMEVTLNPASGNKYYFPRLWEKYLKNDTVMTPDEYRYLYLGYMFQEDYDPYRESPYTQITDSFRDRTTHTKEEIDTIRKYAEKALDDNPFDLRQMSFLVHVLKERKKDMSAKIWEYRLEHLLGAIKSTGTGEDAENAWFVIYPMHEYDMVQLLGYEAVDVEYVEPGFDHLIVQPDGTIPYKNPASGFYFNVLVPQQQYDLKHPEDSEGEGADMGGGPDIEEPDIPTE